MAEISGFFNSAMDDDGNYDREYLAETFAAYFASFIGNGVFPNPSTGLQVIASSGMNVILKAGQGWIEGYWYHNTDDMLLTLAPASGTLTRYDAIVFGWNTAERSIYAYVKEGVASLSPQKPTPQRDADAHERIVAYVKIDRNIINITQTNIQDTRMDSHLCGYVHGVVDQIDTTTLGNQLQTFIDEYIARYNSDHQDFMDFIADLMEKCENLYRLHRELTEQQYNAFITVLNTYQTDSRSAYEALLLFLESLKTQTAGQLEELLESIKGLLSDDVAGNLAAAILDLQERVRVLEDRVLSGNLFTTKAWLGDSYLGAAYMTDDTGEETTMPGDTAAWLGNSYLGAAYLVNTTS